MSVRILVVHHSRSINDEQSYLTDDYQVANMSLFGAQELDTWAGVRLLSRNHQVFRLEICGNYSKIRLLDNFGKVLKLFDVTQKSGFSRNTGTLKALIKYLDPTISQFGHNVYREIFEEISLAYVFDLWWFDTQFYDAAIPSNVKSIVRSVNFEPVHVLSEDPTKLRFIRAFLKHYSEKRIGSKRNFLAISPLDAQRYKRIGVSIMQTVPLRQISFLENSNQIEILQKKTFLMTGSTYEVRHNLRNLEFVLNDLAPRLLVIDNEIKIQVFGNRFPNYLEIPPNVIYCGFDENLRGKILGSTGVIVPFSGGAGMQSKVFEPLFLGATLIANPKSFVGYDFKPDVDYLPATNIDEYVNQILRLTNEPYLKDAIAQSSMKKSKDYFSQKKILELIESIISDLDN